MNIKISLLLGLALFTVSCSTVPHSTSNTHSVEKAHWDYDGKEGPEFWGSLDASFSTCAAGVNQAPVNLSNFIEADLTPLKISYKANAYEVINNGHTIQVNHHPGSKFFLNGHSYELKQFHFHSPSENHFNGRSFPMEAHLVHADESGHLAVIGVMFAEGQENSDLQKIWDRMPNIAGDKSNLPAGISAEAILPLERDYYRFNGSLTTPPCSEGVLWLMMKTPVTVSKEQMAQFNAIYRANNRPVQAIRARAILQ